ncbi:MAG: hypothetical protein KTR31_38580 [Myxococcales bacterium]|nr:hypothetical protein [Myxococcales bacterium]
MNQKLLPASIVVLALAIVYASTPTATAQERPVTAVCEVLSGAVSKGRAATVTAEWMNQQIAAGRDDFVKEGLLLCAW